MKDLPHKYSIPGAKAQIRGSRRVNAQTLPPCAAPFCFGCLNAHFHSFLFKADTKTEPLLCVGSFHHAALNLHQFDGQWRG
ncbi:hypothetical protein ES332_A02G090400v1 [Gossypium tomentosum]|uniref:Uncharacterized protein n=1 Tax=Gossypium tomentosum TaxID=34277 RepID=A0A5D2RFY2_GOSTO|nr:hypothetical protein ES332_A02G090400v1 [Gossypium tomentosum]